MSIVKMKRLRLVALGEQRDELLARLLHVGCVEVTEPEGKLSDPEWTALVHRDSSAMGDVKGQVNGITSALDALQKYAPVKSGLFIKRRDISEADFFDRQAAAEALRNAGEINENVHEITQLFSKENRLSSQRASLVPWSGLDLPLETRSTEHTHISFGVCPAAVDLAQLRSELGEAAPTAELILASSDKEQHYLLLVCHRSEEEAAFQALKPHSYNTVQFKEFTGTAAENLKVIDQELGEITGRREAAAAAIVAHQNCREALQLAQDRFNQELSKEQVRERMLTNGTVFFLEGWATAPDQQELEKELSKFACAYEFSDPEEGDTVPTKLKNPKWMECINMVTEMYSLPAYNGIDPNPLMFFWYVFFFGFMFADVAYGIIIFAVSLAVIKLYNPKKTMGKMFHLGLWLGGSTALCGIFVGGFFGNALEVIYDTFLPNAAMPGWMQAFCNGLLVNPIADPMTVLIIAVVIGCLHLVMGQCIHIYMGFRDGTGVDALLDVVPWWLFFAGIGAIALAGTPVVLIIGVIGLIATQGRHEGTFFMKLFGGVKSLYDVTSWLSDILSYARLMALMLATSVIAMVFNTLGALPHSIIAFVIVFVIGHVFNIGVNLIGTYVHAARLQYLEYFNKFYVSGGVPFRPLQYDTKYTDIVTNKEEK